MPGAFAFDTSFAIADFLDLGVSLMMSNRHEDAVVQFDYVLGFDPYNRYARWNKCIALLSLGRYDDGWLEHDWAWTLFDWRALGPVKGNVDRLFDIPLWTGGRDNVVLYHEMGFGDAIMLMRFIPQLVAMCKSVTLIVRPELVSLMRGRGAKVLGSIPEDVSMFNSRATLFNSVGIGKLHKEIPNDPYIKNHPQIRRLYSKKLGIAWSGNSQKNFTINGFLASIDLTQFNEIFALQKIEEDEIYVGSVDRVVRSLHAKDFKETAEAMLGLDCLITVDTAAAHLAGAIGHPNAHVVIPYVRDWRWWQKDLWYPTLNIYPQKNPNDWASVFSKVNEAICTS